MRIPDPVSYETIFRVIEKRGEYPAGGAKGIDIKYLNVLPGGFLGWDGDGAGDLSTLFSDVSFG